MFITYYNLFKKSYQKIISEMRLGLGLKISKPKVKKETDGKEILKNAISFSAHQVNKNLIHENIIEEEKEDEN